MPEPSRWCPSCGAEYLADIETCADCEVPLADAPPAPADHDTVTYDFADATEGQRRVVELLLRGADIPFSWENDTDLAVPHVAEDAVDELLEHFEAFTTEGPSDEDFRLRTAIELGSLTLRRVGTGMYYVGGIGLLVFAVEAISTLGSVSSGGFGPGGWLQKLAFVLSAYTYVLFAALVIGFGAFCRLFAQWVTLRLDPTASEKATASPLLSSAQEKEGA